MKRFLMFAAVWLLTACTFSNGLPKISSLPQPLPQGKWFQVWQDDAAGSRVQSTLLAVEPFDCDATDAQQYCLRFVQSDALGAPVARQVLYPQGQWRNDGFLPPKPEARKLFAAVAQQYGFATYVLIRKKAPDGATAFFDRKRLAWLSRNSGSGTVFTFPDQSRWTVSPLAE